MNGLSLDKKSNNEAHVSQLSGPARVGFIIVVTALIGVAMFFRIWKLGNIPGINGDEAWYGVRAAEILNKRELFAIDTWFTPTGNLLNPFYMVPSVFFAATMQPSVITLRLPALISGCLAIALNFAMCRRIFGVNVAMFSTLILVVLPVNIAYSRFGWDASQTLLASVLVVYLAISIPICDKPIRKLCWTIVALGAAVIVHPTNIFLLPLIVVHAIAAWPEFSETLILKRHQRHGIVFYGIVIVIVIAAAAIGGLTANHSFRSHMLRIFSPLEASAFVLLLVNLFSGVTIFQYISGALRPDASGQFGTLAIVWQLTGLVFTAILTLILYRRLRASDSFRERRLLLGLCISIVLFYAVAGTKGLIPGFERYSQWLIVPATVLVTQTVLPLVNRNPRFMLVTLALFSGAWLAGFYFNYFHHIYQTGGTSHIAFRTGDVEPKIAVLQEIQTRLSHDTEKIWIVSDSWWTHWPIRYFSMHHTELQVVDWSQKEKRDLVSKLEEGSAVFVCIVENDEAKEMMSALAMENVSVQQIDVMDYSGKPTLIALYADAEP